jgi:hypothetical protein
MPEPEDSQKQRPPYQDPAHPESVNVSPAQADGDQNFGVDYLARLNHQKKIADQKNAGVIYHPVAPMKFTLLCICMPFHAYEIWWLYRQFVNQKDRQEKGLSPLWRVNIPLFYVRPLLNAMRDEGKLYGLEQNLPVEKIVLYWVLLIGCMLFPPPWGMLGTFTFAPFIFVNDYLIKLNKIANPDLALDTKYSVSDFIVIICGGAFFAFNVALSMGGGI